MTAHLIQGDARRLPLTTGSVQCVVTSPPFYGLRSYNTKPVIWGGDPDCSHALEDGPSVKPLTGGAGAASTKQVTNAGSQFGNAWAAVHPPGYRSSDTNPGPLQNPGNTNRQRFGSAVCTRCEAWSGELGSEPTPALFVSHMIEVFAEVKRVLRDDGVCFLNIGDSYSTSNPPGRRDASREYGRDVVQDGSFDWSKRNRGSTRPKSLLLVPERLAIALSDAGWIIRSRIAWCKAAPMPESVRDRPTSAWEHIWVLTKRGSYYWDADAVRQDGAREYHYSPGWSGFNNRENYAAVADGKQPGNVNNGTGPPPTVQQGANLRNFWVLNPDPYPGAHFATFPREIPRHCIAAATSEYGACAACGAPWRRVVERTASTDGRREWAGKDEVPGNPKPRHGGFYDARSQPSGWQPTCRCGPDAGVRPCIVLDPFSGSGTTAFVAASLGRVGVGVELSWPYLEQTRYGRLAQGFLPLAPAAAGLGAGA